MATLPVGIKGEHHLLVTPEVAIDFLGHAGARVLSTPHMIGFMEMTCRNLIKEHVAQHEDSVGTLVDVKHLAATPIGMKVRFSAEILAIDGRRVTLAVEAWDEVEKVGEGTHERFLIDVERFASKVQQKAASQAA